MHDDEPLGALGGQADRAYGQHAVPISPGELAEVVEDAALDGDVQRIVGSSAISSLGCAAAGDEGAGECHRRIRAGTDWRCAVSGRPASLRESGDALAGLERGTTLFARRAS